MSTRPTPRKPGMSPLAGRSRLAARSSAVASGGAATAKFQRVGGARTVVVGIADCKATTDPRQVLLTYALGSCLGVAVWNRKTQAAALLHAMLPDSTLDPARAAQNPYVFVDTGLKRVLEDMLATADSPSDLVVKMAGGASLLDSSKRFQVGQRNVEAARGLLAEHELEVAGEDTGGNGSRTMVLQGINGRVSLRRGTEEIGTI